MPIWVGTAASNKVTLGKERSRTWVANSPVVVPDHCLAAAQVKVVVALACFGSCLSYVHFCADGFGRHVAGVSRQEHARISAAAPHADATPVVRIAVVVEIVGLVLSGDRPVGVGGLFLTCSRVSETGNGNSLATQSGLPAAMGEINTLRLDSYEPASTTR